MTTRAATQPRFRWLCRQDEASHELFLLVLPFAVQWSNGRPGPISALAAALMALAFGGALWAQGWGRAGRRDEALFVIAWSGAWATVFGLIAVDLAARVSRLALALPVALAMAGPPLILLARARRRRRSLVPARAAVERPLAPAAGALAIMVVAASLLHVSGARSLHFADLASILLAWTIFLALRRRERGEGAEISR